MFYDETLTLRKENTRGICNEIIRRGLKARWESPTRADCVDEELLRLMKKKKDVMEQDRIEFDAYKFSECGEEIMTMKQLKVLAGKYRKLRNAKDVIFSKWGNSIAVRIPSDVAEDYNISVGKHGTLTKDKEGIKIIPNA